MTWAATSQKQLRISESVGKAGVLARTTGDLLGAAFEELTTVMKELDARHPLRNRLWHVGRVLQSARELSIQTTNSLGAAALQARTAESVPNTGLCAHQVQELAGAGSEPSRVALVVEGDDGLRGLMGAVIRKEGYRVLEARTGEEAEQAVARGRLRIDKLVTELLSSGVSGVPLSARLRLLQPNMGIVYTVRELQMTLASAAAVGSAKILRKPFTVAGLSSALKDSEPHR